ncbi:helix-turn-helix domain-containing protein [Paenibacillus apii]|nr:helix-turn-helix transcriptional regulator [Paenibacillus apii]
MSSRTMKLVGERIRALREQRKWSQMKLGELAELHYTYIGRIERGENNVTMKSIEKVAAALDVPFEELFRFIQPLEKGRDNYYLSLLVSKFQSRSASDQKHAYELLSYMLEWKDE